MNHNNALFIVPILIFIVCLGFFVFFTSSFKDVGDSNFRLIQSLENYQYFNNSILFIGDSQIREDIDCNIIESSIKDSKTPPLHKKECYNLGIAGILPLQIALFSDKIISTTPEHVVIGVSPLFFNEEINKNDDFFYFIGKDEQIKSDSDVTGFLTKKEFALYNMHYLERIVYMRKFILPHYVNLIKLLNNKNIIKNDIQDDNKQDNNNINNNDNIMNNKQEDNNPDNSNINNKSTIINNGQDEKEQNSNNINNDLNYNHNITTNIESHTLSPKKLINFKNPHVFSKSQTESKLQLKIKDDNIKKIFTKTYIKKREIDSFEYLIKQLTESNIEVTIIFMPLNPLLTESINTSGIFLYDRYFSDFSLKSNVNYVNLIDEFDSDKFIDLSHLNEKGRTSLSQIIVEGDYNII